MAKINDGPIKHRSIQECIIPFVFPTSKVPTSKNGSGSEVKVHPCNVMNVVAGSPQLCEQTCSSQALKKMNSI